MRPKKKGGRTSPSAGLNFPPAPTAHHHRENFTSEKNGGGTACAFFVDLKPPKPQEPEAAYVYTDSRGNILFRVLRLPGKEFRQQAWDARAERWLNRMGDCRRVLYRLPEVLAGVKAGRTIYICEGEKDADAVVQAGGVGTCNPGGAGKWLAEFAKYLRGANVVVVQDKDGPGHAHALAVRASLKGYAKVCIVEAAAGKDAADHLAAGYGLDEFVPARRYETKGPQKRALPPPDLTNTNGSRGLAAVLGRLPGAVATAQGQWEAACPAHDDQVRSLSVGVGRWRPVLLYCHAGCESKEVLAAIGLTWKEVL